MNRLARAALFCACVFAGLSAVAASAQPVAPPAAPASTLWLVVGGAFTTLRGDCQTCEADYPYRHTGSLLVDVGRRVHDRMDVAAEVFWIPLETAGGQANTTHIDAVAQFRPWASHGFFVKGGAGLAFVRNWVDVISVDAINSKALSVMFGAGWVYRPTKRLGLQWFATQHATALGDLQTAGGPVQDVMVNAWSVGAGVVIR